MPTLVLTDSGSRELHRLVGRTNAPLWALVQATTERHLAAMSTEGCERVISIEPCADHLCPERIAPIVYWEPTDLEHPNRLRQLADLEGVGGWIGAVVHAGIPGEIDKIPRDWLKHCESVVTFDWHKPGTKTVAAPYLTGAARIVGAAGYNFFWECRWLGFKYRTQHYPLCGSRIVDDQGIRVENTPFDYVMTENGAQQLANQIADRLKSAISA